MYGFLFVTHSIQFKRILTKYSYRIWEITNKLNYLCFAKNTHFYAKIMQCIKAK